MGRLRRSLRRIAAAAAGLFALTLLMEIAAAARIEALTGNGRGFSAPVQVAVVLGARLDPDGALSWAARRRVATAVALLEAGGAERLLFSGGTRIRPEDPSAAERMRALAEDLGAPAARLLVETESHTTLENLERSCADPAVRDAARVALVSDAFHLARAWALARLICGRGVALAAVDEPGFARWSVETGLMHLREAAAWWVNLGRAAALVAARSGPAGGA